MSVVVPVKIVPDLVEELIIDDSGVTLDAMELSLCLNEFDDHAIEQAILLKEQEASQVTVIIPDLEEADNVLFNAAAKGTEDREGHKGSERDQPFQRMGDLDAMHFVNFVNFVSFCQEN